MRKGANVGFCLLASDLRRLFGAKKTTISSLPTHTHDISHPISNNTDAMDDNNDNNMQPMVQSEPENGPDVQVHESPSPVSSSNSSHHSTPSEYFDALESIEASAPDGGDDSDMIDIDQDALVQENGAVHSEGDVNVESAQDYVEVQLIDNYDDSDSDSNREEGEGGEGAGGGNRHRRIEIDSDLLRLIYEHQLEQGEGQGQPDAMMRLLTLFAEGASQADSQSDGFGIGIRDIEDRDTDDDDSNSDLGYGYYHGGFQLGPEEVEQEEEEEEEVIDFDMSFDPNLPLTHSYLGDVPSVGAKAKRSRLEICTDGSTDVIQLIVLNVVLFPGQQLPLRLFSRRSFDIIRDGTMRFGVVYSDVVNTHDDGRPVTVSEIENGDGVHFACRSCSSSSRECESEYRIGTLAEVLSVKDESKCDASGSGSSTTTATTTPQGGTVTLLARGIQRFQVLKLFSGSEYGYGGVTRAVVRYVGEGPDDECECADFGFSKYKHMHKYSNSCGPTHHLSWVYRPLMSTLVENGIKAARGLESQYKDKYGVKVKVKQAIHGEGEGEGKEEDEGDSEGDGQTTYPIPSNPTALSYFLSFNLPIDNSKRQMLLSIPATPHRLAQVISVAESLALTQLKCRFCESIVASKNDIFAMSVAGVMGTFVNPGGYIHDMVTLRRTHGIGVSGGRHLEDSWFPEYAWSIAHCTHCFQHVGWRFDSTNDMLHPSRFWGIRREVLM